MAHWSELVQLSVHSITVVLYSREQFRDITRSPQWAAGMFDGEIRVPVHGTLAWRPHPAASENVAGLCAREVAGNLRRTQQGCDQ